MGEVATVEQLLQEYVLCARDVKDPTLVHLVHQFLENKTGQVIVFTNKCRSVGRRCLDLALLLCGVYVFGELE